MLSRGGANTGWVVNPIRGKLCIPSFIDLTNVLILHPDLLSSVQLNLCSEVVHIYGLQNGAPAYVWALQEADASPNRRNDSLQLGLVDLQGRRHSAQDTLLCNILLHGSMQDGVTIVDGSL